MYQPIPEESKPVPQLGDTGVSQDYFNAFCAPFMIYLYYGGMNAVTNFLCQSPIAKYTERFSPIEYRDVVTSYNRATVSRLDAIADTINRKALEKTLSDETYRALHTEACQLIYGKQYEVRFS